MSLTPNFGFNIPASTDIVNLLTQCYPNFTLADTAMQAIKEQGISQATESKSGTVHNIVRVDSDCSVLWFTATSNFTVGDTFTVDGSPVTAVKVSGAGLETGDFVINSNVPCIVKGSVLTVLAGGAGTPTAQDVSYDNTGSGLVATDVQDAIDEITAEAGAIDTKYGKYVTGTIVAGSTSITLVDASITTSSFIDIYFKDAVLAPVNVTVISGSVTIDIEALANNQDVAVRITNL